MYSVASPDQNEYLKSIPKLYLKVIYFFKRILGNQKVLLLEFVANIEVEYVFLKIL